MFARKLFYLLCFTLVRVLTQNEKSFKCPVPLKNCHNDFVKFHLYFESSESNSYMFNIEDPTSFINAPFKTEVLIKIIFPGHSILKDTPVMAILKNEYLETGVNVLIIDYTSLSVKECYRKTMLPSLGQIGKCVANFLDSLVEQRSDISMGHFHLIGFGIGAHVAANTSVYINQPFNRITGLDPQNIWCKYWGYECLHRKHAFFVDIYHTNVGREGSFRPTGDLDVYFNDGKRQPGCSQNNGCSHRMSVVYFTLTIRKNELKAIKCNFRRVIFNYCPSNLPDNTLIIGDRTKPREMGTYGVFHIDTLKLHQISPSLKQRDHDQIKEK